MRLLTFIHAMLLVVFSAGNLFADHTHPQGSVAALDEETQSLAREVYYAPLNSNVKYAVNRFVYDVRALDQCADQCKRDESATDDHTGHGVPAQCMSYYSRVRSSFYPVDRYLYDTNYDLPRVYAAYLDVRNSLNALNRSEDTTEK